MTERHAMEAALATEQRRFELVVRAGNVGILDWDGVTRSAYYSPRLKELLGYARDAATSACRAWFFSLFPCEQSMITLSQSPFAASRALTSRTYSGP